MHANNVGVRNARFPHFRSLFVRINCTSNMSACYDNDADDVTAPRVYERKNAKYPTFSA